MLYDRKFYSLSLGHHAGALRDLSHMVKKGDSVSIAKAAELLSSFVNKNMTLVPIPQHSGDSEYTYSLCRLIAEITGAKVVDALFGFERMSSHEARTKGLKTEPVIFFPADDLDENDRVWLIDNTVTTCETANAARRALNRPFAPLLTITNAKISKS